MLGAALGATGWSLGWFRSEAVEPAPAEPRATAPTPAGPAPIAPATATLEVQTPAAAGIPEDDCILYPDGSRLPPLNGVKKAPRVVFNRILPYTKVVGRTVDAHGTEWYVHENGVWSTTRLQKTGIALGEVMMPTTPKPVSDR